jgi:hypothetical protein
MSITFSGQGSMSITLIRGYLHRVTYGVSDLVDIAENTRDGRNQWKFMPYCSNTLGCGYMLSACCHDIVIVDRGARS